MEYYTFHFSWIERWSSWKELLKTMKINPYKLGYNEELMAFWQHGEQKTFFMLSCFFTERAMLAIFQIVYLINCKRKTFFFFFYFNQNICPNFLQPSASSQGIMEFHYKKEYRYFFTDNEIIYLFLYFPCNNKTFSKKPHWIDLNKWKWNGVMSGE